MSLALKVETLEGLDESIHSLYVEKDGVFHLDVDGVEDVAPLKSAFERTKQEKKDLATENARLRQEREDAKKAKLTDDENWKGLYETEKEKTARLEKERNTDKTKFFIDGIVSNLTKDDKKGKVLKSQLKDYVQIVDGEIKIVNVTGVETAKQLTEHYKEHYGFLVDGSKASGGGATGSKDGSSENLLTKEEVRELPEKDKRAYFAKHGHHKYKE